MKELKEGKEIMDTSNNPNIESVADVIRKIESKEIVLPEFQRDFVWDLERRL